MKGIVDYIKEGGSKISNPLTTKKFDSLMEKLFQIPDNPPQLLPMEIFCPEELTKKNKKMIIAISGKKGHGKDMLGSILIDEYNFKRDYFARPIKESAKRIFGFTEEQVNGSLKEEIDKYWGFSPRWAIQQIGTDLFRENIDKDVWIKSLKRRIKKFDKDLIVITDARFPNEVDAIRELGGIVFRIKREGYTKINKWIRLLCYYFPKLSSYFGSQYHMSEIALDWYDDWDYIIENETGNKRITKIAFRNVVTRILLLDQ